MRREREENRKYMSAYEGNGGAKVLEVDTHRARFHGRKVDELDQQTRRKFENALFIDEQQRTRSKLVVRYR